VVEGDGGVTVRLNGPLDPPHDPAKPSTTIMYVWPAVTVGVTREPWFAFAPGHGSDVPHESVSSLHASSAPLQVLLRT